jgi:hypothetical protein
LLIQNVFFLDLSLKNLNIQLARIFIIERVLIKLDSDGYGLL